MRRFFCYEISSPKILIFRVIMIAVSSFYNIVLQKLNQILFYQTKRFLIEGLCLKTTELW